MSQRQFTLADVTTLDEKAVKELSAYCSLKLGYQRKLSAGFSCIFAAIGSILCILLYLGFTEILTPLMQSMLFAVIIYFIFRAASYASVFGGFNILSERSAVSRCEAYLHAYRSINVKNIDAEELWTTIIVNSDG